MFLRIAEIFDQQQYDIWEKHRDGYPTIAKQLYELIESSIKYGLAHPLYKAYCEFMESKAIESIAVKKAIEEKIEKSRLFYEGLFEEGIASGEFKAGIAKQYGTILESMVKGINESTINMEQTEKLELYRVALNVLLHGIVREPTER